MIDDKFHFIVCCNFFVMLEYYMKTSTDHLFSGLLEAVAGEDFLLSLATSILKLHSPTKGKFLLLSSLSSHVLVQHMLKTAATLPQELLTTMGQQSLACKVC